ncbi:MAG: hypothetical protein Q8L48_16810 [Archangium sp.]|nr:hypothetical protein [Archangium sp.]
MTASFEVKRQMWLLEARARLDDAIRRGVRPRPIPDKHKGRYPAPALRPVPIATQYQNLRARVLAGEITPQQAGFLFSLARG